MAKPKQPKVRTRYGIGEWYGQGFETLPPRELKRRSQVEDELNIAFQSVLPPVLKIRPVLH